ncbi:MAG TPA: LamG domain-containing protein, partial [Pirellulales bacterium]|nr:LamG domain-containing protein [Pirellulales bacterium]
EGDGVWRKLAQLDNTPEVTYRRAWTAAEFQGRLFFSTLPSGKIFSYQAGVSAMHDDELPSGWQHVAAIKSGDRLQLYVNGARVAESAPFKATDYDLASEQPLRIGFGANDYLRGKLRDVRIYERTLNAAEIRELAKSEKAR